MDKLSHCIRINMFSAGDGDEYASFARNTLLILYCSLIRGEDALAKAPDTQLLER